MSLKTLEESYKIVKEEEKDLMKKHELVRKADFFLNEGSTRLDYKNVIESVLSVSQEITSYYEDLKKKFNIYKIKCYVKERLAFGVKFLNFMLTTQINVTEKFKTGLQAVDEAYKFYLSNEQILHHNNDEYFKKEDYRDLLQIFNVKRIGNIISKDLNLISDEVYSIKEQELKSKIKNLNISDEEKKKNEDLFEIDEIFLNSKKEKAFNIFIEFVLNKYNYENFSQEEITQFKNDYFFKSKTELIDNLKNIYTIYNYETNDEKYKIVAKIEGYLNNIKNFIRKKN
jgi:hypothetical protein